MDEDPKQKKTKKNTLASIFVFLVSCWANGIKILGLGIVQMVEINDSQIASFLE